MPMGGGRARSGLKATREQASAYRPPPVWRVRRWGGLGAVPVGGGAWPTPHGTEGAAGVEGAGGIGGPGCGARGRWRGLAGLRDDAPSEARGAGGSRAAGPSGARNTRGATRNTSIHSFTATRRKVI